MAKSIVTFGREDEPIGIYPGDSVLLGAVKVALVIHGDLLYPSTHVLHVFFDGPASEQELEEAKAHCRKVNLWLQPFEDDPNCVIIET